MGIITSGILGGFSGKVGPVVGGKWKETDYMRAHIIPANPNSLAQQAQRGAMSQIVAISKQILSAIIQTYWNPFQSSMSGYNAFVKQNVGDLAATTFYLTASNTMAEGSLVGFLNLAATYDTATGEVAVTWDDNSGVGNALATDSFCLVLFDQDGTLLGTKESTVGVVDRSDEADSMTVGTGYTATELFLFGIMHRGTGSSMIVSNAPGVACTAP